MMIRHRRIKLLLYDYLMGELSQDGRHTVEDHLATCLKCANELTELQSALEVTSLVIHQPSEERPVEFWQNFTREVENKIQAAAAVQHGKPAFVSVEHMNAFKIAKFRPAVVLGVAIAMLVVALIVGRSLRTRTEENRAQGLPERAVPLISANDRMGQYFRKSKTLLVGIENMKVDERQPVDLKAERRVSRQLIHEARYLKSQPIDVRSAKLIGDLEKILIELANMKEENNLPNVEIIRGGIHQENLLFKIRMAESLYDTVKYVTANITY
ncbi:MAG: zf-HC2 domain-containing protein [Ignavibacteriales bacterium]|nr:zf-HC2 domain-containing protein [Ignavibacteriales bacterium]